MAVTYSPDGPPFPAGEVDEDLDFLEDEGEDAQTLASFIEEWQDAITSKVIDTYRPRYQYAEDDGPLPQLLRSPIGSQESAIRGASLSLKTNMGTTMVGEMGVGKTYLGIAAAQMAGFKRIIVLCPPHLTAKWKREIEMTLSHEDAVAVIASSITDLQRIKERYGDAKTGDPRTVYVVMSRERAKLSYQWENVAHWSLPIGAGGLLVDDNGEVYTKDGSGYVGDLSDTAGLREVLAYLPVCPECSQPIVDKDGVPLSEMDVKALRRKLVCLNLVENDRLCGAQLWTANSKGRSQFTLSGLPSMASDGLVSYGPYSYIRHRIGLAEYIQKKMRRYFDLFIADEVHEYKAKNSAQGIAAAALANVCGRSLVLTGTLMGGYASTLFFLLYRFYPEFRSRFDYSGESQWIQRYGFYEETIRLDGPETVIEHGRTSRRKGSNKKTVREKPGLLPGALFHLIENSIFLRLSDVASDLPPYDEHILTIDMDREPDATRFSQWTAYNHLYREIYSALVEALMSGSQRLLATYLQTLLAYPDGCTKGEECYDPLFNRLIAEVPPLDSGKQYPKEKELRELITREKRAGRRVLVYVTHTETRDITGRVKDILQEAGIQASVLKSAHPKPENREAWVAEEVSNGADALICHPKLVQTGLDLIDFPTIVWYETEYSVYTMRQASRRSWRIGQTNPVAVYYMTYADCLQADALALVAAKMQSSLAVEGELPEEGLSAYGDSADNLIISLAKQITGRMRQPTATAADIEEQFRRAREMETEGDTLLVSSEEQRERPAQPREEAKEPPEEPQPTELPPAPKPAQKRRSNGHSRQEVPPPEPPKLQPLPSGQIPLF